VIGRRRAREALEPALRREGALSHQGEAGSVRAPVCTAVLNRWTDAEGPRAYHGGAVCHAQGTHGVGAEVEGVISPSTVTGRCCGVGGARIGAFRKRNSRSTSGSSRLSTTSASEAKRCWVRSLSSWSAKTPESNKSLAGLDGSPTGTARPAWAPLLCGLSDRSRHRSGTPRSGGRLVRQRTHTSASSTPLDVMARERGYRTNTRCATFSLLIGNQAIKLQWRSP